MNHTPKQIRRARYFLVFAFMVGAALRLAYPGDMEWKEDEQINFTQSQQIAWQGSLPWTGMPSGVYLPNPGMSVWVFGALAKISGARDPVALSIALRWLSLLGIALIPLFAWKWLKTGEEKERWLWAFALALVNPFAVFYQRKLWPEPFLPFFAMLFWMGWWRRKNFWGAFTWGLIGAWLGQIHMSGFFLAAAVFAWTLLFNRKSIHRWGWLIGSIIGALPLIPWLQLMLANPTRESMVAGWGEALQLKYWVFWLTDPTGLHLGNPLGLLRGSSNWTQISDFARYPLLGGSATYLIGGAHALALVLVVYLLFNALYSRVKRRVRGLAAANTETDLAVSAGFWGYGLAITATTVVIRRYYLMVTFPLEFIWLTTLALRHIPSRARAHRILLTLWFAEAFISAGFVWYIHVNQGSIWGDYGVSYNKQVSK